MLNIAIKAARTAGAIINRASLDLDRPQLRATLAASHLVGLAFVRYVVKLEPVASADRESLVAEVGPTIQRYFTATQGA